MPKLHKAVADGRGKLHSSPRAATVSDLAALFGGMESMAVGIANQILDKRAEIEQIYRDHDECVAAFDNVAPITSKKRPA